MKQLRLANLAATAFSRDVGTGRRVTHLFFTGGERTFFGMRLRRENIDTSFWHKIIIDQLKKHSQSPIGVQRIRFSDLGDQNYLFCALFGDHPFFFPVLPLPSLLNVSQKLRNVFCRYISCIEDPVMYPTRFPSHCFPV